MAGLYFLSVFSGCVAENVTSTRQTFSTDGTPVREATWQDGTTVQGLRIQGGDRQGGESLANLRVDYPPEPDPASAPKIQSDPASLVGAGDDSGSGVGAAEPGDLRVAIQGTWDVDLEATLQANPDAPADLKAALRRDLGENPFSLEITSDRYVSRSKLKTRYDVYDVKSVKGHTITLNLRPEGAAELADPGEMPLSIKSGKLHIYGAVTVVMRRR